MRIVHHKTRELVEVPLSDDDGNLWPELTSRLDAAAKTGTLLVTRDKPDRRRKICLPWNEHHFRHRVSAIREAAGISADAKFMGLRHAATPKVPMLD